MKDILKKIDKELDKLEKTDIYGDIMENFMDIDKDTRHTTRLIEMINDDLKRCR